jgi:glycosyltransferase involved in cell wall biosynthesis
MKSSKLVSIIVRTKNEEKWISSCLKGIFSQEYKNLEVIIVDNNSSDKTVDKALAFPVKLVSIEEFLPGKAINLGINNSTGEIIVCLSGHCIPVNNFWLGNLVRNLDDPEVAGVYGRQEPLSYSSDFDKRDLITVFGLDRKIQLKDSFFHNANSAFKKEVWEKYPFDEVVTNIEDRVWGQLVTSNGMKIIYEPEASVYHWHGIHHDGNPNRARNVVKILESLPSLYTKKKHADPSEMKVLAMLPIRGKSPIINGKTLLEITLKTLSSSQYVNDIVVLTDEEQTAKLAIEFGAKVPFMRPSNLSEDYVDVVDVLNYSLSQFEQIEYTPDLIVILEETYPFRPSQLIDEMILALLDRGYDTVIAAKKENRAIWKAQDEEVSLVNEGFMPRALKKTDMYVGLMGLCCITHASMLRDSSPFDGNLGFFEVADQLSGVEIKTQSDLDLAKKWMIFND